MSYTSTILITGGTTGLGYEAALAIAEQRSDALIIIASRSNGDDVAATINKKTRKSNAKYCRLDLSNLTSVRQFATDFTKTNYPPISALVLNAGLQISSGVTYTSEGLETTFGVNHVGHALLLHLLTSHLKEDARIIITSSGTHDPAQKTMMPDAKYENAELMAHPDAASLNENDGRQRYSSSKLCNVLWTYALNRHRTESGKHWTVTAFDPGLMPGTGLARDANAFLRFLWNHVLTRLIPLLRVMLAPNVHTPRQSGQALARLAIGEDVKGVTAKYFEGMKAIDSSKDSYNAEKQEDLWRWTVEFLSQNEEEAERFQKLE